VAVVVRTISNKNKSTFRY